ncbi:uncharacterized protein LOC133532395 isoform X1 [Cydia pomonella]|uniref:uncharacterized protein LOC133532395 isoform X1 n=1 Tax=Cydia pomonella TaxID=82600 RepID=UPI002ADE0426|nr:uncharacterized protein LOC133532395 isoform X1 [Cydia pomonella]
MAVRTKLVILVLTSLITRNLCDNDVLKLSIDDSDLLRGSGEEKENLEKEIEIEDKSELEEYTTTEYATTDASYIVTFNDLRIDTTVESTTEDNGVVRTAVPEDIYNGSNIVKTETTTSPPTRATESMEGMSPRIAEFDGEETKQRSPKLTESARPEPQPQDRPVFDPSPTEAITPRATLRNWLEDPWLRAPAGLLVPLRSSALARASAVWDDLSGESLRLSDVVLVGYHANGINWRSRHNLQGNGVKNGYTAVSDALNKLLTKYQGLPETSDGTMQALISATKLVPYDSALFVLTDRAPGDLQRLPLAVRALVEKRLKVYTIWTNPSLPAFDIEHQLQGLKNVSKHTEGEVLMYTQQGLDMGLSDMDRMQLEVQAQPRQARLNTIEEDEKFETLLVRRGGGGATSLGIPVEYGVTALKIYIEGDVEHAVLYPPNDAPQVDLYNMTSVRAFSAASRTDELSPREVFLVFPGSDPQNDGLKVLPMKPVDSPSAQAGMWHLSVRCDTCNYHMRVLARAQLRFHASLKATDMLNIRIMGPVASVRESALVDEYGAELTKLPFSYQTIAGDGKNVPQDSPMTELEETIPLPNVKAERVYVRILGRDIRGEPFVRLSGPLNEPEVRMGRSTILESEDLERAEEANIAYARLRLGYNDSNVLPYNRATSQVMNQHGTILTAVQIGLSTRLYGTPGDNLQLHFEVTNYRDQSVRFSFEARGELRFLTGISPSSQTVLSGQTVNVVVSVGITNTAQPGARDLITFTAIGIDQVSISAYVYVVNTVDTVDVWAPELRHTFQGMCIGKQGDDCAQHIWSTTITARDASSGLLRLTSTPIGLVFDSNFISGTREEIRAIYRATCCAPRLSVTAVDANGNVNSYIIDISGYLSSASIAAITLSIFLAIAIIALIIFLIYWCVRRRKESRELPYSTSTRN